MMETKSIDRPIFQTQPVSSWKAGIDSKCVYVDTQWLAFTGNMLEDELGEGWIKGVHADDRDQLMLFYHTAFRRQEAFKVEYRLKCADGTYRWVLHVGSPIFTEEGIFDGYHGTALDIQDQKTYMNVIEGENMQFRELIDYAAVCIFCLSQEGSVLWTNQAMLDMLDYDYEDLAGRNLAEIVIEPKEFRQILKRLRIKNELSNVSIQLRSRNRETRFLNVHMSISWQSGAPMLKCYGYDVTQKKNEESALRERNRTLQILNSIGTKILSELDQKNLVNHVISSAVTIVGADSGLFIYPSSDGKSILIETLGSYCKPILNFGFSEFRHEEESVRIDDLSKSKDYRKLLTLIGFEKVRELHSFMYVPLLDRASKVIGGFYFVHHRPDAFSELSEILVNGIALQASIGLENSSLFEQKKMGEERFRILAESLPHMVWTANSLGEIDYCNQRWEEYTGLSCTETAGMGWLQSVKQEDMIQVLNSWKDSINNGKPYEMEYRIKKARTQICRWHLVKALPIKDQDGNVLKWFGTCTDIEEQKQINQRKDDFISIASHELKTPLTSIKGYVQLLEKMFAEEAELPVNAKAYISKTNRHVDKLNVLIGDLMDVTRIQTGKLQYRMRDFDFSQMVNESVECYKTSTSTHEIELKNNLSGSFHGDKERLEQVFTNLLNNAIKYSPAGTKILVEGNCNDDEIIVSVTDYGIGIPKDKLDKIFERFYRVEDKQSFIPGLGIGLYICAEIVRRHQGKIWVNSESGKFTSFHFSVPRLIYTEPGTNAN